MFCPVSPKAGPEDQGNDRIRTLLLWLFSKFSQESQIMPVRKKWGDAIHRGPRLRPLRYKQPCTEGTPSLRIRFSCSARPSLLQCCLAPPGAPRVMTSHLFTLTPNPSPHPKVGSVSLEAGAQQCMVHSEDPVTRTLSLPTPGDRRPVRVPCWTGDSPADLVNTLRIDGAGRQSTRCGVSFGRRRVP